MARSDQRGAMDDAEARRLAEEVIGEGCKCALFAAAGDPDPCLKCRVAMLLSRVASEAAERERERCASVTVSTLRLKRHPNDLHDFELFGFMKGVRAMRRAIRTRTTPPRKRGRK